MVILVPSTLQHRNFNKSEMMMVNTDIQQQVDAHVFPQLIRAIPQQRPTIIADIEFEVLSTLFILQNVEDDGDDLVRKTIHRCHDIVRLSSTASGESWFG
jgi:hypothetical protein